MFLLEMWRRAEEHSFSQPITHKSDKCSPNIGGEVWGGEVWGGGEGGGKTTNLGVLTLGQCGPLQTRLLAVPHNLRS